MTVDDRNPAGVQTGETGETEETPTTPDFPKAALSLRAARKLVGRKSTGKVRVIRRFVSAGIPTWAAEARLVTGEGIDYEVDVSGDSVDEVAYVLLDTLERIQESVDEE